MDLQPQKPTREFRFKLALLYKNGEEEEVVLPKDQDDPMEQLLQQLTQFITADYPVSRITIDVGDRRERWIPKGQEPLTGMQTLQDIQ